MKQNPYISILIPAYNEEKYLSGTIDSIHHCFSEIAFSSYEIIVCDNNSTDATAEIAKSKGAKITFEPHNQISRARNTAAKAAQGEWFIFLDADTILNPALLSETIQGFKSGKIFAGGVLLKLDSDKLPWGIRFWVWLWRKVSVIFKLAPGAYLFCYREAWAETGGFNEQIYVTEEIWFSNKLKSWCRKRGRKFKIITKNPIITSSRKLKWFTSMDIVKQLLILLMPNTVTKKHHCKLWYTRPEKEVKQVL